MAGRILAAFEAAWQENLHEDLVSLDLDHISQIFGGDAVHHLSPPSSLYTNTRVTLAANYYDGEDGPISFSAMISKNIGIGLK